MITRVVTHTCANSGKRGHMAHKYKPGPGLYWIIDFKTWFFKFWAFSYWVCPIEPMPCFLLERKIGCWSSTKFYVLLVILSGTALVFFLPDRDAECIQRAARIPGRRTRTCVRCLLPCLLAFLGSCLLPSCFPSWQWQEAMLILRCQYYHFQSCDSARGPQIHLQCCIGCLLVELISSVWVDQGGWLTER